MVFEGVFILSFILGSSCSMNFILKELFQICCQFFLKNQLHKKLLIPHSIATENWRHIEFSRALKCHFEKWRRLTLRTDLERKHKSTEEPEPLRIRGKGTVDASQQLQDQNSQTQCVTGGHHGQSVYPKPQGRKGPLPSQCIGPRKHMPVRSRGGGRELLLSWGSGTWESFWHSESTSFLTALDTMRAGFYVGISKAFLHSASWVWRWFTLLLWLSSNVSVITKQNKKSMYYFVPKTCSRKEKKKVW